MARAPRFTYPGAIHHVMARSQEERCLFATDEDRLDFLQRMAVVWDRFEIEWRMFVLMNTHFHAKLKTPHGNISAAMQYLLSHFAQAWNRRHGRRGHVLDMRFKAPLIEDGWYSRNVVRYIALNPVKANYVSHAHEWPWSSHRALAGSEAAPAFLDLAWLRHSFIGATVADSQRQYRKFIDDTEDDPIELVESVLEGSPEFSADAREVIGRTMHRDRVPRRYRSIARPDLQTLFFANDLDMGDRNRVIIRAQVVHGYTQSEIARALDLHPNTISKITVAARRRSVSLMRGIG